MENPGLAGVTGKYVYFYGIETDNQGQKTLLDQAEFILVYPSFPRPLWSGHKR